MPGGPRLAQNNGGQRRFLILAANIAALAKTGVVIRQGCSARKVGTDVRAGHTENCDPNIVKGYQTDGWRLPLPDQSVTAAYFTIVFQHFDSPDIGLAYFREFYRVMKSGGTFMINLPWHQFPNASLKWPYRLADHFSRGCDRLTQSFQRLLMRMDRPS
jgi:hypothetical protein